MPRVLHLASDLGPTAVGKQLSLLAPALAARGAGTAVAVLGGTWPFGSALEAAGVAVRRVSVRHPIDLPGFLAVRRAVIDVRPDVVCAWGDAAIRATHLLRGIPVPVVAAGPGAAGGWLRDRALRAAAAVVAFTPAGAERAKAVGVAADRIRMVPLAVAPVAAVDLRSLGLPAGARVIAAAGRLDASADGRTAVWAFDVLRYADPNLYLLLVGGDPGRGRLERLADALAFDDNRVRFAGPRADAAAMLAAADVVWVTATRGGVNVALEAMAAGRPVVAVRNSDLAGLVDDALVVPPTDRVRLAAVTNELFASPDRLAAAGGHGRAVAARHTVPAAADALAAALSDVRPA